jgi:hypothetical protein
MAFDLGNSEEAVRFAASNSSALITRNGKVWMPVEITLPGEGFYRAWRIGARKWHATGNKGEGPALYPLREAWAIYPPVTAPGAGNTLPDMPAEEEIVRRFKKEAERLNQGAPGF